MDFAFYLLATPASNYTRNERYFERVADLIREKLGAYKPGQFRPSEEDFKPGIKEKIRFFNFSFLKKAIINCLILRLSIATQLSTT